MILPHSRDALRPWLRHLVITGGWAGRLHRFHESHNSLEEGQAEGVCRERCALPYMSGTQDERSEAQKGAFLAREFRDRVSVIGNHSPNFRALSRLPRSCSRFLSSALARFWMRHLTAGSVSA